MLQRLRKLLRRSSDSRKEMSDNIATGNMDERRKEALKHLIEDYYRTKERKERLKKKFESMNPLMRLLYKAYIGLKIGSITIGEVMVTPLGLALFALSSCASVLLAMNVMSAAAIFIDHTVPFPLNYPTVFTLATCIVFSPAIISFELYVHREKNRQRRLLKAEYGIDV